MRHIIFVWFLAVILAGCVEGIDTKRDTATVRLSDEERFKQWEKTTLVVGSRWAWPPVWEHRAIMTEANREFTKYKVNPTCDGYYYVTVRDGVVTDIWSTLNQRIGI